MDAPPIDPPSPGTDGPGPADAPAPDPGPTPRRLRRRVDDRLLGGVAGGVADFFGVDVVLVRLGFVVAAFFGGIGVLAYVLGWVVLPVGAPSEAAGSHPGDRKQLLGYGLVALGLLAIGGRVGLTFRAGGAFWPLALIALGAAVLWLRTRDVFQEPAASPVTAPSRPPSRQPTAVPTVAVPPTVEQPTVSASASASASASGVGRKAAKPARPKSHLGALTWCALLILAGTAWVLDATGAIDVDLGLVFALALALVGLALVVSAWFGRARGLIALGLPLVLVVGAVSIIDVPLDGGIGRETYHPRTAAAIHREYTLAIGNLSIDLRGVDFSGSRRRVHARLGIGRLNVTVPTGVRVVLDGHVRAGTITAFGRERHSCCPTDAHVVRRGRAGAGTVVVDAVVGAGHLHVDQAEESLRAAS